MSSLRRALGLAMLAVALPAAAQLASSPARGVFTARVVGSAGPTQSIVITNTGSTFAAISAITMAGDFTATGCGPLPKSLAPNGGNCTLVVSFTPTGQGTRAGSAQIRWSDTFSTNVTLTVPLFGSGSPLKAGYDFNGVVTPAGVLWMWGGNGSGQLGNGTTNNASVPVRVPGLGAVASFAVGERHALAVRTDGTVWSWGDNASGQLGHGASAPASYLPVQVPGLANVVAVAAGSSHSMALDASGNVWSWGSNVFGELGRTNAVTPFASPGLVGAGYRDVAANGAFSLALRTAGTVAAWGANDEGQLGNGTTTNAGTPVTVSGLTGITALSAGYAHALALKGDGTVWSWGWNRFAQLGDGNGSLASKLDTFSVLPAQVLAGVAEVGAGYTFSFARGTDGSLRTWGNNFHGQLARTVTPWCYTGYGTSFVVRCGTVPGVADSPLAGGTAAAGGGAHLVVVLADGSLAFRGLSSVGQAGPPTGWFRLKTPADLYSPVGQCLPGAPGVECILKTEGAHGSTASIGLRSTSGALNLASLSGIAFSAQASATVSPPSTLQIDNSTININGTGGTTFNVLGVTATGDFLRTTDCATLGPMMTCSIDVTFAPTARGDRSGTLTITTDLAGAQTITVDLFGVGVSVPGAPAGATATAGSGQASVSFGAPADDGGTAILDYTVTASPGGATATGPGSPLVVAGLSAGTAYTFIVRARNAVGIGNPSATSNAVTPNQPVPPAAAPRLVNISTRMQVLTGQDVLIGGLVIGGTQPKTVVVRARGPSLIPLGVPNALANPVLQLFSGPTQIAVNDNWKEAANQATLAASGYAPANDFESAIHTTLNPGAYTAIVTGAGATTGVGIIEVFEVDKPEVPLINIATRGQVLTGGDVMIAGFIIQGSQPQTVAVRARGPSLASQGVVGPLQNPRLQLFSGQTEIASNDDWQQAGNAATITASGFAPADSRESVILVTLNPGAYTAIVTGVGGTTGVAIVEVFGL